MAIERIVDTSSHSDDAEEQRIEVSLRPQSFSEYVGQERLKRNLRLAIEAAKKRGEPLDHVLLYGPPGLGKTTMATEFVIGTPKDLVFHYQQRVNRKKLDSILAIYWKSY